MADDNAAVEEMKSALLLLAVALALAAQQPPEVPHNPVDTATIAAQAAELQVLRIQVQFYIARDAWQAAEKALEQVKAEAAKKAEPKPATEKQ